MQTRIAISQRARNRFKSLPWLAGNGGLTAPSWICTGCPFRPGRISQRSKWPRSSELSARRALHRNSAWPSFMSMMFTASSGILHRSAGNTDCRSSLSSTTKKLWPDFPGSWRTQPNGSAEPRRPLPNARQRNGRPDHPHQNCSTGLGISAAGRRAAASSCPAFQINFTNRRWSFITIAKPLEN